MKGIRKYLREITAIAVREHLRSKIEETGASTHLTKNEIHLLRFILDYSFYWGAFMSERRA